MTAILSQPQYVNGGHQLSASPGGCCIVGTLGSARSVYSGKTLFWLATADCCNSLHPRFVQRFVAFHQIGMCIINVFTCMLTGKFNNDSLWMTISQLFSPHTVAVVHRNRDFIYYQIIVNRFVNHLMTWSCIFQRVLSDKVQNGPDQIGHCQSWSDRQDNTGGLRV